MWFAYIVLCHDKSLYTGITNNPKKRLQDHQNGKGGHYTRSHKPIQLLYTESFRTKADALKREVQIKGWRREKKLNLINLKHPIGK